MKQMQSPIGLDNVLKHQHPKTEDKRFGTHEQTYLSGRWRRQAREDTCCGETALSLLGLDECQSSALSVSARAQGLSESRLLRRYRTQACQPCAFPSQNGAREVFREQDSFPSAGCVQSQPSIGQLRADRVL